MAKASTTSSLGKRWPNVVAPSSCISGGGSSFVFSSPRSGKELAQSASGIFARCGPFGVRRAVNRPLVQSISGFLALNHGKPRTRLYAFGSWDNSSFLSRLGDIKMLVAPQSISALTCCMLPCMFRTRTSWMICDESGLSVPHRYWLDIRARPSRMTLDFKAIQCGCISSKVTIKARFPKFSNPNSVLSSLSRCVRYRER